MNTSLPLLSSWLELDHYWEVTPGTAPGRDLSDLLIAMQRCGPVTLVTRRVPSELAPLRIEEPLLKVPFVTMSPDEFAGSFPQDHSRKPSSPLPVWVGSQPPPLVHLRILGAPRSMLSSDPSPKDLTRFFEAQFHVLSHVPRLPQVIYFFGLPGAGKSFSAAIVSEATGACHYEADDDLPDDIRASIAGQIPFTEEQRDRFYARVATRIQELLKDHPRIVVSQATFKERHRRMLQAACESSLFALVNAPENLIAARLASRGGAVGPSYSKDIAKLFEPPSAEVPVLSNRGDGIDLLCSFASLIDKVPTR